MLKRISQQVFEDWPSLGGRHTNVAVDLRGELSVMLGRSRRSRKATEHSPSTRDLESRREDWRDESWSATGR